MADSFRSLIWRRIYMMSCVFPAPVRLGPRAVAWVKSEIRQWAIERGKITSSKVSEASLKFAPGCRAFADAYVAEGTKLPSETQASRYYERLTQTYPIHPEIFDRLYKDWTTIDGFQRTRGALRAF